MKEDGNVSLVSVSTGSISSHAKSPIPINQLPVKVDTLEDLFTSPTHSYSL